MDNNDQNKVPSGLTEENLKWLEEMTATSAPDPEPAPATEPEQDVQAPADTTEDIEEAEELMAFTPPESAPAAEPDPDQIVQDIEAEQELDEILATDWDHITLPEQSADSSEDATEVVAADESIDDAEIEKILNGDNGVKDADSEASSTADEATETDEDTDESVDESQLEPSEPRKRPRKKDPYGLFGIPHVLSTVIWLAVILVIGMTVGRILWVFTADLMAFGKEDQKITITITAEDNIDTIAKKLGQAKLVKYPDLFKFFAKVTGKHDDICVGTYTLSPRLDYNAMINAMYREDAKREVVEIMFPEGVNCAQIFKLLEEKGVCTVAALEDYAVKGDLNDYWFLEGLPRNNKYCLEGYLAPDTYAFYKNDSPRRVLEKFLTEFDSRFTDKMRDNFETMKKTYASMLRENDFSEKDIADKELTLHQVITLASIIQKEAASDSEGFDIAAVFYARLCDPDIMSLGADITVHYALGDYFYDIKELTVEQLEYDSPYNTRKNKGIPPGPICNMGAQSLYAALEPNPEKYEFKYFVYDEKNKVHVFSKTEKEHEQKKKELGY